MIKDVQTRMHFAHVAPRKGMPDAHAAEEMTQDIKKLGYGDVILKSDGEPALIATQEEVQRRRGQKTVLENSPVGDSRANGHAERAAQTIAKQVSSLRKALEDRVGISITGGYPVGTWVVEHAADVV